MLAKSFNFPVNKTGECPRLGNQTDCVRECYTDADCRDGSKCCVAGCSQVCVPPALEGEFITHPPPPTEHEYHEPAPVVLEEKPEEEINVIQPEGDVATLRCFATGYPLPTVTWKRQAIVVSERSRNKIQGKIANWIRLKINTNQGRFSITSNGDLQIVQVHKTDTGTYVCVADNGLGEPVEREVKLEIAGL